MANTFNVIFMNVSDGFMKKLGASYSENVAFLDKTLRVSENFDVIKKIIKIGRDELTLYYIDGLIKDAELSKLMTHFLSLKSLTPDNAQTGISVAQNFLDCHLPYVEADATDNVDTLIQMFMSGACVMLGSTFGSSAIIIDARTYPARETGEPEGDKVMRGARDGFVETLIFNTALIRRRIRNPNLTMKYMTVGESSRTDIVMCYMDGVADPEYVKSLSEKLSSIKTDSLTLGHESLAECLIRKKWYNPFPKVRCTERPDAACASIVEGSVIVLCDTSPEAMILPTAIFDFLQETNDYYYPCFTGTYLRLIRQMVFWGAIFLTPIWYTLVKNATVLPNWISFIVPDNEGPVPIIAQLLIVEFDCVKPAIASIAI